MLLFMALVIPALADDNTTVISFSDLDLMTHADVQIYAQNGTAWELAGTYNTTSTGLEFEPGNYMVVLKPSAVARLWNPVTFLTDAFGFLETYWLQILLAFSLIILAFRKW